MICLFLSLTKLYEREGNMPFGIFPASNGLLLADRSVGRKEIRNESQLKKAKRKGPPYTHGTHRI